MESIQYASYFVTCFVQSTDAEAGCESPQQCKNVLKAIPIPKDIVSVTPTAP